ncbi:HD domain-containing phosphohydrolase [Ruminococcus sp.]|uniref:HD domain-containing phosphohydrolase n=1 Tax=Ruminococcus sp. TaxID=41978 RepID=UPI0025E8A0AC|nr:HD domain-containing phosphohydrolase [Ruminococcus sp.]MBQ8965546.1 response regulator [Ruminococcus sp.]
MEEYLIAVADDDKGNLKIADRILSLYGYRVDCLTSGEELLEYIKGHKPDLILLDVHMTGIDGFETIQKLKADHNARNIPVIFLTADDDAETETKALTSGAADFVGKPFVASVLLLRVKNTIELNRLQRDLKKEAKKLSADFIEEHRRNERLSMQVVETLAGAVDAKDKYTNGHSTRVAEYSREIARSAGYPEEFQERIYMMGLLHDVGKIGVPDSVINKPTKLTPEEYDIIKQHPVVGHDILKRITEMPELAVAARWHHERYDGTGYPDGLKGEDIPEEARIIAVADAYDAMSSRRSYHDVFAQEYIRSELINGKGTQFDPRFADIMLEMIAEDTEYSMREDPDAYLVSDEGVAVEQKQTDDSEFVFGFLSMLEANGLDTAVGMKYCMNDTEFYAEMLTEFTGSSDDRVRHLEECVACGNLEQYRVYIHSLKSASKTVGAMDISEKAAKLEEAAISGDGRTVVEGTPEVIAELRAIVGSILMAMSIYGL